MPIEDHFILKRHGIGLETPVDYTQAIQHVCHSYCSLRARQGASECSRLRPWWVVVRRPKPHPAQSLLTVGEARKGLNTGGDYLFISPLEDCDLPQVRPGLALRTSVACGITEFASPFVRASAAPGPSNGGPVFFIACKHFSLKIMLRLRKAAGPSGSLKASTATRALKRGRAAREPHRLRGEKPSHNWSDASTMTLVAATCSHRFVTHAMNG